MPNRRTLFALAAVAAVLLLAFFNTFKRGALHRAAPVCSIADWQQGYAEFASEASYVWLSDHELLHIQQNNPSGVQIMAYNTQTQRDTPIPGLIYLYVGRVTSVSPDGQWVLWNMQKFSSSPVGMAATRCVDGKTARWHLQTDRSEGHWLPDSRHWVAITSIAPGWLRNGQPQYGTNFSVFCVDHPGVRMYRVSTPSSPGYILGATPQGKIILNNSYSGWGTPGQATPPLSFLEVSLQTHPPTVRAFQVPQPQVPAGRSAEVLLSPRGDRLLWSTSSTRPSNIVGWLSLWTRHSFLGGATTLDIWTCPINGGSPQHIGTWSGQQISFPSAVCWNPDGKHISFTLNGTLQSVSVD